MWKNFDAVQFLDFGLAHFGTVCWSVVMMEQHLVTVDQTRIASAQNFMYALLLLSEESGVYGKSIPKELKVDYALVIPPNA